MDYAHDFPATSDAHDEPGGPHRRGLLKCMAWAGTGVLWTMSGGVPRSNLLGSAGGLIGSAATATPTAAGFSFVQISDSHIGFANPPNTDTPGTLREAVGLVAKRKGAATLMLHTGDVSQLSKPAQFDTAQQIIGEAKLDVRYVPGEHDVLVDDGRAFFERFTPGAAQGWYSWDQQGVHFVALNNVQGLKAGGLGNLGAEQLRWLDRDLAGHPASQPVVVFAHVPLWTVSAEWGWGTDDGAQALAFLRRFGSVTVLNGHIHQVMQKIEGNVAFHTALSTAFPQPAPSPGPIKDLPAGRLRSMLGIAQVTHVPGRAALALVDTTLGAYDAKA